MDACSIVGLRRCASCERKRNARAERRDSGPWFSRTYGRRRTFNILLHVDPRHALFNMQTAPIMHFLINHARILMKSVQRSMVSSVGSAEPWFRITFSRMGSTHRPEDFCGRRRRVRYGDGQRSQTCMCRAVYACTSFARKSSGEGKG